MFYLNNFSLPIRVIWKWFRKESFFRRSVDISTFTSAVLSPVLQNLWLTHVY